MTQKTDSAIVSAIAHCADLVRRRDEDRWLSANYAPPRERARLFALYALHAEIERIPGVVSEAPLGEIRLQWWRDALDEVNEGKPARAHPVVEAMLAQAPLAREARASLDAAIDSRARLLYKEPFSNVDELAGWLARTEGALAVIAARSLDPLLSPEAMLGVEEAAVGNALARIGPALAPHLGEAAPEAAARFHKEAAQKLGEISALAMPALAHFRLTPSYLARGKGPSPIRKRIGIFSSIARGRI